MNDDDDDDDGSMSGSRHGGPVARRAPLGRRTAVSFPLSASLA